LSSLLRGERSRSSRNVDLRTSAVLVCDSRAEIQPIFPAACKANTVEDVRGIGRRTEA
jgi:hypothetical protein